MHGDNGLLANISVKVLNQNRAIRERVVSLFVRQQHKSNRSPKRQNAEQRLSFHDFCIQINLFAFRSHRLWYTQQKCLNYSYWWRTRDNCVCQEWISCEFSTSFRSQTNPIHICDRPIKCMNNANFSPKKMTFESKMLPLRPQCIHSDLFGSRICILSTNHITTTDREIFNYRNIHRRESTVNARCISIFALTRKPMKDKVHHAAPHSNIRFRRHEVLRDARPGHFNCNHFLISLNWYSAFTAIER